MDGKPSLLDLIKAMKYRTMDWVDLDADISGNTTIKGMSWFKSIKIFIKHLFS
ncbi:MAG: hypothetical protein BWY21_01574 [Parcubacteria group bacterium ADurb.Bin216]|nr:MAG: hypothetical protein BWY21_01574 [Parcubacteria group bacterium ADurb.Bin216]